MIRREEARLRAAFRRALLIGAGAATPLAAYACGSSGVVPVPEFDSGAVDATTADAADASDEVISFPDSADVHVSWCSLGPPVFWDAGNTSCDFFVMSPCGLPDGAVPLQCGALVPTLCHQLCDGGAQYGCQIPNVCAPDGAPLWDGDGAPPGTDDSGAIIVECLHCNGGRRTDGMRAPPVARGRSATGGLFARLAYLEHASIAAFARLRDELRAHRAPASLVRGAERAMRDEARHARVTARIARDHGASARRARVARRASRPLVDAAIENAIEGCVRETYGACVAAWQATHAGDPRVRDAMKRIAIDETRHATLSWSVARWMRRRLSPRERDRVDAARARAVAALRDDASADPARALVVTAGVPTAADARAIVARLARDLWT